jgi:type II secretory pathway component PulM
MASFFAKYSYREKAIVALAVVVLTIMSIHALIIEPYQLRVASVQSDIEQQSSDLLWMKSVVSRLPSAGAVTSTNEIEGSLANFIDIAVRKQGLKRQLSQMTPIGSDEIRMRYSEIDFNRMVDFIAHINSNGLEVKDIRITTADNPGIVDSSIVLVRQ